MRTAWWWVLVALALGLAVGALVVRHEDRAAARTATAQADRQAASYDSLLTATSLRDVATRDSIGKLRVAADSAAGATLEAKARTQTALDRLVRLARPAATDSTNPEWQRIVAVQQDVITGQAEQITGLTTQVTKLDVAYRADSARAAAWERLARAGAVTIDSLKTEVHVAAVGTNACRLLFWPCPSRKVSAVVGVVAGAVAVGWAVKK